MCCHLWNWLRRQEGQDLTEYGLLMFLVVIILIASVMLMGQGISSLISRVVSTVTDALTPIP